MGQWPNFAASSVFRNGRSSREQRRACILRRGAFSLPDLNQAGSGNRVQGSPRFTGFLMIMKSSTRVSGFILVIVGMVHIEGEGPYQREGPYRRGRYISIRFIGFHHEGGNRDLPKLNWQSEIRGNMVPTRQGASLIIRKAYIYYLFHRKKSGNVFHQPLRLTDCEAVLNHSPKLMETTKVGSSKPNCCFYFKQSMIIN